MPYFANYETPRISSKHSIIHGQHLIHIPPKTPPEGFMCPSRGILGVYINWD